MTRESKALKCNHLSKAPSDFTPEEIYQLKFKDSAILIAKMDSYEKTQLSQDIIERTRIAYETINNTYDAGLPIDEAMRPKEFIRLMARISHWEILLNWTYEIDILLEKYPLELLIEQAVNKESKERAERKRLALSQLGRSDRVTAVRVTTPIHIVQEQPQDVKDLISNMSKLMGGK